MALPVHLALTQRDLDILGFVYNYSGVTVEHIRRFLYPNGNGRSACYDRVARLVQGGFLRSLRLPAFSGVGSGKTFLTCGAAAYAVLTKALYVSREDLGRASRMDSPYFIAHHLGICDFHLRLELATQQASSSFDLLDWRGDGELKQSPLKLADPRPPNREISLVPDAVFILGVADGREQPFCLELDRGTVSRRRLKEKLRGYLAGAAEGMSVLFVVPDGLRQARMARWATEEAQALAADPTIFWLTTQAQVEREANILESPIWQIVGGPEALSIASVAKLNPPRGVDRGSRGILAPTGADGSGGLGQVSDR